MRAHLAGRALVVCLSVLLLGAIALAPATKGAVLLVKLRESVSRADASELYASLGGVWERRLRGIDVDRVLVAPERQTAAMRALEQDDRVELVERGDALTLEPATRRTTFSLLPAPQSGPASNRLTIGGPSTLLGPPLAQVVEAADPYLTRQWALEAMRVPQAWAITTGRQDVQIALMDTGLDYEHPDRPQNVIYGRSYVAGAESSADDVGHGTQLAGIIGAPHGNAEGVAGIAPRATVGAIKVTDARGWTEPATLAEVIVDAVDSSYWIVNLSLGWPQPSETVRRALAYADRQGVLVVAAAGNCGGGCVGRPANARTYPAAYERVLAVTATDRTDRPAPFSESGAYVALAAPGVEIATTAWPGAKRGEQVCSTDRRYCYAHGTSMAAAAVSSVAALVWAANPTLSHRQVAAILAETAVDVGPPGRDPLTGAGRVDALAAVEAAVRLRE
ncbi:MAG: S8 family serine peptidase [Chloroflexi bacterium]|nr:S8 family serine peptidase [Chloroflexota bacterium]